MYRFLFAPIAAFGLLGTLPGALPNAHATAPTAGEKPNIIFIMVDDMVPFRNLGRPLRVEGVVLKLDVVGNLIA